MLTPLPLTLQVPGACEAGLTTAAEGGIPATWQDGDCWRVERQDPASSSTHCSLPLLPAQQQEQQRSLCRAPCHLCLFLPS